MTDLDELKNKLEKLLRDDAVLKGREEELLKQREQLVKELTEQNVTVETLDYTINTLQQQITKGEAELEKLIHDLGTSFN